MNDRTRSTDADQAEPSPPDDAGGARASRAPLDALQRLGEGLSAGLDTVTAQLRDGWKRLEPTVQRVERRAVTTTNQVADKVTEAAAKTFDELGRQVTELSRRWFGGERAKAPQAADDRPKADG